MRIHYFIFAFLFLSLTARVKAQTELTDNSDLVLENVHYSSTRGFQYASKKSIGILYRERNLVNKHSRFYYTTLDSTLQKHTVPIQLYRRNKVLFSAGNASFSAHLFKRVDHDSLKFMVLNRAGDVVFKKHYVGLPGTSQLTDILTSHNDSAFIFVSKNKGHNAFFELSKVNLQLKKIWTQKLAAPNNNINFYKVIQDGSYLWAIGNGRGNKRVYTIICIDQSSGQLLSTQNLQAGQERRDLLEFTIGPDHRLTLIGRWFPKRIKNAVAGQFFMTSFSPDGQRTTDIVSADSTQSILNHFGKTKILWQHISWNPAGHWELVGETFKSSSWIKTVAIGTATGLATMGLVRLNIAWLTTQDLVHLQLTPEGKLLNTKVFNLPPKRMVASWAPAYEMAALAKKQGYFNFRGVINNPCTVLVKTKTSIQAIRPDENAPQTLVDFTTEQPAEVLTTFGNQLIIFNTTGKNNIINLKPVLITAPLQSHNKQPENLSNK